MSLVFAVLLISAQGAQGAVIDDWEVLPGFSVEVDTRGYELPTSIAFVPEPGARPEDPLYYVTELGGTVKVVTNDRRVHVFVDGLAAAERTGPADRMPARLMEQGLAGICLDPKRGYVFLTFGYRDAAGVRRNGMVRYSTVPRTFAVTPLARMTFTMFDDDTSAESHQVGGCQVEGDVVYVGVGDGGKPHHSRRLASTLGKILRMAVDGRPARGNPFAGFSAGGAAPYVWALGLRNPFGMAVVNGRLFTADNGMSIDRFLEIARGGDYMWDGTDWGIGARADGVIAPSVSPVQLAFLPEGRGLFPAGYEGKFFVAFSGHPEHAGPGRVGDKSVAMVSYDMETRRMRSAPSLLMRFRGKGLQIPVGVAVGPDGLYFVPMMPATNGESVVLRVRYDPPRQHRLVMGRTPEAGAIMTEKGCLGCHWLDGFGSETGLKLDHNVLVDRIRARLESDAYRVAVAAMDSMTDSSVARWRGARREVLDARGEDRVRTWIKYRIMNPRLDSHDAKMPDLGVTEYQASLLASRLMDAGDPVVAAAAAPMPPEFHVRWRYRMVAAFLAGIIFAVAAAWMLRRFRPR